MTKCNAGHGFYDCYGEWDTRQCYDCEHNADRPKDVKPARRFTSQCDAVDVLYRFLKGEGLPEGVTCKMPKLKPKVAFDVIWFLQEVMHCLPDHIEQCEGCGCLFDSDSEGYHLDDQYGLKDDDGNPTEKVLPKKYWGHWCKGCVPNVDFYLR